MTTEETDIRTDTADAGIDGQAEGLGLPESTASLDVEVQPEDKYLTEDDNDGLGLPEEESLDTPYQDETGLADEPMQSPSNEDIDDASAGANEQTEATEQTEVTEEAEEAAAPDIEAENEAIRQKIIERKKEKRRKARRRRMRFWTILTILLVAIAAFAFSMSGFFTVDSIDVSGNSHFTAEEIINIAHAVPGHNLIYDPGDKEIVDYLTQNPYIKSATVTRKFPSTLLITVVERKQACAFRYDDDYLIMDDEGILLKKTRTQPKLTMVTGLVVSRLKLGETIGTENKTVFSRLLKLIRAMNSADLYFVSVDMTAYEEDNSVRAYIYDKLVVRSGYDQLVDNMKNGRLHKVVEKLFSDGVKRGTIIISDDGTISFEPGF